jgi:two-component system LytT family response regulator
VAHLETPSAAIRVLVVDDEPLARCNLTVLLRRDPDIGLVAECGSGSEAIVEIRNTKPDLVFLDVQMPECDGFDVLEMLGSELGLSAETFRRRAIQKSARSFQG